MQSKMLGMNLLLMFHSWNNEPSPESAPKGPRPLPGRRRVRAPRGWPYPEKAVSQTSQADEVEVARLNPLTEAICRALYGEQAVQYVEVG